MHKGWIDVVSAQSPLCRTEGGMHTEVLDEAMRVLRKGSVPSRCGRSVIHIQVVARNMTEASREAMELYGNLIIEGIHRYCCASDDYYLPKDRVEVNDGE